MSEAPTTSTPTPEVPLSETLFPKDGEAAPVAASEAPTEAPAEPEAPAPEPEKPAEPAPEKPAEGEPVPLSADSYTLTLPEGFTADEGLLTTAKDLFVKAGVKPDAAQPLVDLFVSAQKAASDAATSAARERDAAWIAELDALPEFTGPTREKTSEAIGKLYDVYGSDEARRMIDASGIGNNPALVKMFAKIANALNEGGPTPQGRPANPGKDGRPRGATLGQQLFPEMNS